MIKIFAHKLFIPSDPVALLRLFFSLLSLLALLKYATNHSYSEALELIIKNYDVTLGKLLSPIKPVALLVVNYLGSLISIKIELEPQWRHIFVLMGIYFMSRVGSAFKTKLYTIGTFRLIWGILVAFFTSLAAGSSLIADLNYWKNAFIALAAVGGMLFYELIINVWYSSFFRDMQARLHMRAKKTWWQEFMGLSASDFIRALIAALIVLFGLSIPVVNRLELPGLVMLALVMFLYGCFWLFWAWRQEGRAENDDSFSEVGYWSNTDAIVGISMVSTFFWAAMVVILDTGAKLLFV